MAESKQLSWPAYSLIVIGGFAFSYVVGWAVSRYFPTSGDVIHRSAGGVLQLLGVFTIALGISQMRRMFGLPNTIAEMLSEWGQYVQAIWWRIASLFGKRRNVSVGIGGVAAGLASVSGRGHVTSRLGANATLQDRVRHLEEKMDVVSTSVFQLEGKIEKETRERAAALETERHARLAAYEQLERLVKTAATSGIRLQSIGVIWFILGISLGTWAQEISS